MNCSTFHDGTTRPRLIGGQTLVWRGETELQVGVDDDAVVLSAVPRCVADLLPRLDGTRTVAELATELGEPWVRWVVDQLARHGRIADGPPPRHPRPVVRVLGTGALGGAVTRALAGAGAKVLLGEPSSGSDLRVRQLVRRMAAVRRPGHAPAVEAELDLRLPAAHLSVVAPDAIEPDRALTDMLVSARHPHLLVRLRPDRAVVGPLVVPGRTACVRCHDLATAARDPAAALVLCELSRLEAPPHPARTAWAAAMVTVHALAHLHGDAPDSVRGTVELGDDGVTGFRRLRPHPACWCRGQELRAPAVRMGA